MAAATDREAMVEAHPLNASSGSYPEEIARVCDENALVIVKWSPVHLRSCLSELYWKDSVTAVRAAAVWEDMQKYLYLARLRDRAVLEQVIIKGAATKDFFGTAYGQSEGEFQGFKLGDANVQLDDTLLLIEPGAAAKYAIAVAEKQARASAGASTQTSGPRGISTTASVSAAPAQVAGTAGVVPPPKAKAFFGSVEVKAATAKMAMVTIADEMIAVLAADPTATVRVTVEISAEFPNGASEQTRRAAMENATALGFRSKVWES